MNTDTLFIGLHGAAGSGKDTVAKMLSLLLNNNYSTFDDFRSSWMNWYTKHPNQPATYDINASAFDQNAICIAFADQLKEICAKMFGLSVERFYYNKSNGWICINDSFRYTEIKPETNKIITAEEYYYGHNKYNNTNDRYYMSLREILVYVGTYICQEYINKNCFINIVNNNIERVVSRNRNLRYVIITDVRFCNEMDYIIGNNNGLVINIVRDDVTGLSNIAEHDMDDVSEYSYTIDNSGSYEDLLITVWDLVHNSPEFRNETIELPCRDVDAYNYMRLIGKNKYKLCLSGYTLQVSHINGEISMIDPSGGPTISIGSRIPYTDIVPKKIEFDETSSKYIIHC